VSSRGYADDRGARDPGLAGAAAVLLGVLVAVLGFFALMMWVDARHARDAADRAAASAAGSMPGMDMSSSASAGSLTSYAGAAPANADDLATAHKPYPATLPGAPPAGTVADVNLKLTDLTVQIAPGVKYSAWAWAGGAPGPVIHVHQGQMVKITLTNKGAIPTPSTSTPRVSPRTGPSRTSCPASPSATRSARTIPASS
jgi:FtsP/CotA-like multicopper oxidase with cupredoxin domain